MTEPAPAAVTEWEAEHGPWGNCGKPGCTDSHAHESKTNAVTPLDPEHLAPALRIKTGAPHAHEA